MRVLVAIFILFGVLQAQAELVAGLYANLDTNKGNITIRLIYDKAPLTVINFVGLVEGTKHNNKPAGVPFYDGLKFHRVIDNFMIQGGDPQGTGAGGPGYQFMDEITELKHNSGGILSMANSGSNTNGSQFFITHLKTPWLDGKHTVFGRVVDGMDVVNSIQQGDVINSVKIIRVGSEANSFKTDENAFQKQYQKHLTKSKAHYDTAKAKLMDFVDLSYPDAQLLAAGYYTNTDKKGDGNSPKKGDRVRVKIVIELADGTSLNNSAEPIDFVLGTRQVVEAIDDFVLTMQVGGQLRIIAYYDQIYANAKVSDFIKQAILIFKLKLLSIN